MYKRDTSHGQTKKSDIHLKNGVRKAKVQKDFVRHANDYPSPESFLWSMVTNKKERFNLWENNKCQEMLERKRKNVQFFLCLYVLYKRLNFIYLASI